jgi:ATP-dependent Clp protease adaptor protein ClpS
MPCLSGFNCHRGSVGQGLRGAGASPPLFQRRGARCDSEGRHDPGVSTTTPTKKPARARPGDGASDRPWQVVVLNDNHNTFEGVAAALSTTLPDVGYEQGLRYADWIHRRGRAVVWSGNRERAELYHERLVGYGLTMAPIQQA